MPRSQNIPGCACCLSILIALSCALPRLAHGDDQPAGGKDNKAGLAELIALGLQNNPQLIALRGEITIATARKQAARDWPDPQIRFRKSWAYNEIPPPYNEYRTENYSEQVRRSETDELGVVKNSTITENIARSSQRTITEGRDQTVIEETIDENRAEITETAPNPELFKPGKITTETRDLQRSGRETRFHEIDPFASEEDLVAQFRLYVPHPGIRKARLQRAQHEIQLARAALLSEERKIVHRIREEYEGLQYLKTRIELQKKVAAAAQVYSDAQDELLSNGLTTIDKIEYVEANNLSSEGIAIEYKAARDRLAARVGLHNPSRIRITDKLISPAVDLDHTHLEYLIRMALANRGELTTTLEKGKIAAAELSEAKARNLPWFDYFQADFGHDEQGGTKTGTNWGIQFAMSLPVFSWLGHERKIHEAAVATHYSRMGAIQRIVTAEVAAAYQNVKRCATHRTHAREHAVSQAKRNAEFFEKVRGMDRRKFEETRYDVTRGTINTDRHRLDAERSYNRALLQLEQALGTSLGHVFSEGNTNKSTADSPVSPTVTQPAPAKRIPGVSRAITAKQTATSDKGLATAKKSPVRRKIRSLLDKFGLKGKTRKFRNP
jgi:outer membrane protein TolC